MTFTIPEREQVFVPEDRAATEIEIARIKEEAHTKRVIVHWSFIAGLVAMPLVVFVIIGLS